MPDSIESRVAALSQRMSDFEGRTDQRFADMEARTNRRLDDLAADVRSLGPLVVQMAEARLELKAARLAADKACSMVEELEDLLRSREDMQRQERKADRRWMIGTVLVAAGLIIGAMQVLLG